MNKLLGMELHPYNDYTVTLKQTGEKVIGEFESLDDDVLNLKPKGGFGYHHSILRSEIAMVAKYRG